MSPNRKHARGFTLIEVLVAIVILGVLLTTVYGAVARTLRSKEIASDRGELFASGRETVLRIAADIEGALHPRLGDRFLFMGSSGGGEPPADAVDFVAMNRGGYGSNRMRSGPMWVRYSLDLPEGAGPGNGFPRLRIDKELWDCALADAGVEEKKEACDAMEEYERNESYYLLQCLDVAGTLRIAGSCIHVAGLRFRYFDDAVGAFRDEWNSFEEPTEGRLPAAVEISLFLADERGAIYPFTTVIDVPLAFGQPTPRPGAAEDDDGGGDEDEDEDEDEDG